MESPKDRILMIMDRLGMSQFVAANAMNMPINTFRKNKMESLKNNNFSEKNHSDLVDYLIEEIKFLVTYKKDTIADVDACQYVNDKIKNYYKKHNEYRKQEGWNLFEELKLIVDFMEKPVVFSDLDLYNQVIDNIVFESFLLKNESNIFTIYKYNDYALGDKKNNHTRWFEYMIYRRQKTIMDILKDPIDDEENLNK
jgi:hypothetical protein